MTLISRKDHTVPVTVQARTAVASVTAFEVVVPIDGSTATETLTEYDSGRSFAYEITDFTNILGRLTSGVRGE